MQDSDSSGYDALLLVSFGGPEGMEDVLPFLDNVLRGRNVPEERKLEVAKHYELFDGISPINAHNRALRGALRQECENAGLALPIYIGNRNWKPYLKGTVREMAEAGHRRVLAIVLSAYSSYSGCRQYRENLADAQTAIGEAAPVIDKLRVFYNHPNWIDVNRLRVSEALSRIPAEHRRDAPVLFTAHSLPVAMATGCAYVKQLTETSRLVAEGLGKSEWRLVYQSRSGPPHQPWLEPDVCDVLRDLHAADVRHVVLAPIGFVSDHLEVVFDLDTEARELCDELDIHMERAATAGTDPLFVSMLRELIQERLDVGRGRQAVGRYGPSHDVCPAGCCHSGNER